MAKASCRSVSCVYVTHGEGVMDRRSTMDGVMKGVYSLVFISPEIHLESTWKE